MPAPVIALEDVALTLEGNAGPVNILRGVTLEVARGETLGLVGPSGSGKSSLLMLMGGLETATGGRIVALGQDLTRMDEDGLARFRRAHMGIVFQSFHLIPTMTAIENVATPLELAGAPDAFALAAAELEAVGLGGRLDHYPAQLSGGEQQRVALARAAVTRPEILLADEPTGNLDPATSLDIVHLLRRIHDSGTTIVMATHDNVIVDELKKRVIELEHGHIVRDEEGGSYVPKAVDTRDLDEYPAEQDHDLDEGSGAPPEDRPIGEVHALDEWDDDAEDLLR